MADLEESVYSYSGTLQQNAFPGCTDICNTAHSQSKLWLVHVVTMPFVQQRRARHSAWEVPGQHTARPKAELPPNRTPLKKVYYKAKCSVYSAL